MIRSTAKTPVPARNTASSDRRNPRCGRHCSSIPWSVFISISTTVLGKWGVTELAREFLAIGERPFDELDQDAP